MQRGRTTVVISAVAVVVALTMQPLAAPRTDVAGAQVAAPDDGVEPQPPTSPPDRLSYYRGLGSWVDIYDEHTHDRPVRTIRAMHAQGVQTIYIETANFHTPKRKRIFRRAAVAKLIEAAHRRGMHAVAWYLPSFKDVDHDYRRAMAAVNFRTPNGEAFDSFAMDIEYDGVRNLRVRNRRMRQLSRRVREAVGPDMTLGAIVPEAGALYWHDFPYRAVDRHYDVFLPMAYFTYRTSGAAGVDRFIRRNVRVIRRETGDPTTPVHVIGGVSTAATTREVRAFADATVATRTIGASMYEFEGTTTAQWLRLQRIND